MTASTNHKCLSKCNEGTGESEQEVENEFVHCMEEAHTTTSESEDDSAIVSFVHAMGNKEMPGQIKIQKDHL